MQFAETQELLKAAKEQLAAFEAKEKEAIRKSKLQAVEKAVGDSAVAEVLFKAVGLVEDQSEFEAVVKALEDMRISLPLRQTPDILKPQELLDPLYRCQD